MADGISGSRRGWEKPASSAGLVGCRRTVGILTPPGVGGGRMSSAGEVSASKVCGLLLVDADTPSGVGGGNTGAFSDVGFRALHIMGGNRRGWELPAASGTPASWTPASAGVLDGGGTRG